MQRSLSLFFLMSGIFVSLMLVACAGGEVFHQSAVVATETWAAADTLFFPVCASTLSKPESSVRTQTPYRLYLALRHTADTHHDEVRMLLCAERLDAQGRPDSILCRHHVTAPLLNARGAWAGSTWGSLIQREFEVSPSQLSFPDAGCYRILLIPEAADTLPYRGIFSLSLSLR